MKHRTLSPGATIGVLGSGQLGRMLSYAAHQLGYRVHVWSEERDSPTGQVCEQEFVRPYADLDSAREFAELVDVVTMEFENLPLETIQVLEQRRVVRPAGRVLHTTQNRWREKTFLRDHGFPVPSFARVVHPRELSEALNQIGTPAVVKTEDWGYDGKGQMMIPDLAGAEKLGANDDSQPWIVEEWVDFECELSVIVARLASGECRSYAPIRNQHRAHILDVSVSPWELPESIQREATACAEAIAEQLDAVGVICVEFFLTRDGRVLVNEIAPRTHNSGHLTIEGHHTSQFEQQVRAVCGLPLGAVEQRSSAAMVNLLGSVWEGRTPNWQAALTVPGCHLHLYGKRDPRPRRKMGHITVVAGTPAEARSRALQAREAL